MTLCSLAIVLGGFLSPYEILAVKADTTDVDQNIEQAVTTNPESDNTLEALDSYVKVENNQFVLDIPKGITVDSNLVQKAEQAILDSNDIIQESNEEIIPKTKEIVQRPQNTIPEHNTIMSITKHRKRPSTKTTRGLTTRWFWWGERFYYRSNAAVNFTINQLQSNQDIATGLGILTAGYVIGAVTFGSVALYYSSLDRKLNYYNMCHLHSYIYMDYTFCCTYSFGTFK